MKTKSKNKIISGALLFTMSAYTLPVFAYTKDETVYSKMDEEGNVYETIVSTRLKNEEKKNTIEDITDLINIENTNGEEEFTKEGNFLIWKADKKDIYYQGESQKDLPIACQIQYELDGKEVTAEEIAGKTGHVKITIQYQNKEEHMVTINGKEEKMYTPFVVVAGTMLKNDINKNIKITNGKVIDDGSKSLVMGIALPGLQDSLNKNEIEIPSDIEIQMDATDFEMRNIMTFVTPKILEENDLKFLDKLDEVYDQVDNLEQASVQIKKGGTNLAEGTNTLREGVQELKVGTGTAYGGAKQIKEEVNKATRQLTNDKSEALDINTLNVIGEQAKQAIDFTEIGKLVANKIQELSFSQTEVQGIVGTSTTKAVTDLSNSQEYQNLMANLTKDEQEQVLKLAKTVAQNASTCAVTTTGQKVQQSANQMSQSISQTIETQAKEMVKQVAMETAKKVANQVKAQAQSNVVEQMNTLGEGLNQLTNGLGALNEGTDALQSGANELNQGANQLANGITAFSEEGIQKICNYMNGDVKDLTKRLEKLEELTKEYNHFTMLNGENEGSVKFVMIMDAIKKQENEDNKKEDMIFGREGNEEKKESTD